MHMKPFKMLSTDTNFIYRAEMASSLANIQISEKPNASVSK